ncbi:hypothetical protein JG687_00016537 [Phytophthora cactorum]|uniref:Uncharacterized protein n=1 Tax=Phytophthora cactorum TaxID=29920 RepID=A0A329SDI3_9STRA|nr:hypothetical protein PC112_g21536 [Phytophthora cactorum]KAG2801556.1 hypothetical protein PC111_g19495 [Phytophthora cactorum]KAG2877141.1 hypothetical protein PC114_g23815 [Phytophthora cactorum]KAG2893866.1 hypothetical protein PC117_g23657 [Phytophthora cactorum]KAG2965138.1 hypothetical protein PC118_g19921 [Phytophthora cactorum]
MVHARAESRCITSLLTVKLEKPVTSQQARNIVRRLEGKKKTEEEKIMHEVGREEGNDVVLLLDQLDITTAVVSQSK